MDVDVQVRVQAALAGELPRLTGKLIQGIDHLLRRFRRKNDQTRIAPKLSYVRKFAPWGWIIGTGIYLEDVRKEIGDVTLHEIRQIKLALRRIDSGTYGVCARCGDAIEEGRLEALPHATHCVKCA